VVVILRPGSWPKDLGFESLKIKNEIPPSLRSFGMTGIGLLKTKCEILRPLRGCYAIASLLRMTAPGFAFYFDCRTTRAAKYPAPRPLSMFITDTPEAQEFSMVSRGAMPPRFAP